MMWRTRAFILSSRHILHPPSHIAAFLQQHEAIHGESSCVTPLPFATTVRLILHMQAFHLTHPMGSSLPPISLSRSLEWHMFIRPFKEIANRLAHFWSCLRLPNPLRLTLWAFIPGRGRYKHYRSLTEEQRWWDESARIRAIFAPLEARHGGVKTSTPECLSPIPLITSYVPRLLPQYRDHSRLDDAANDYELTPSTYRKWHRLVFPHKVRSATPETREVKSRSNCCRVNPPDARQRRLSDTSAHVIAGRSRESHVSSPTRQQHKRASHRRPYTGTSGKAGFNIRVQI